MDLVLIREYFPQGTNGKLLLGGKPFCFTIELPWKNNERKISCIPEGRYRLNIRCNREFGWHLLVTGLHNRDWILVHPANNALTELKGCIAPVTKLTTPGCGSGSKNALKKLMDLIFQLDEYEPVYLIIKKEEA
jgi:hypothetical protein